MWIWWVLGISVLVFVLQRSSVSLLLKLFVLWCPMAYLLFAVVPQTVQPFTGEALMASAGVGMTAIAMTSLVFQNVPFRKQSLKQTLWENLRIRSFLVKLISKSPKAQYYILKSFLNQDFAFKRYVGSWIWILIPIEKSKRSPGWIPFILLVSENFISALFKALLTGYIVDWFLMCLPEEGAPQGIVKQLKFSGMMGLWVICSMFAIELQSVIVLLITFGKYQIMEFNHYVFLSTTPRELWSKRYNLLVRKLLLEFVFRPLCITRRILSKEMCGLLVFSISGLLHSYVAWVTFEGGSFSAFMFFLIHGIACTFFEKPLRKLPMLLSCMLTHIFLISTFPLYLGLFLGKGKVWFLNNLPTKLDSQFQLSPEWCPGNSSLWSF